MYALVNCDVYAGTETYHDRSILIEGGTIKAILPFDELPRDIDQIDLHGQSVAPGFIDVQVNGGGGRLFNDTPNVDTILDIARAHRRFGTTDILPTFITGTRSGMRLAVEAVRTCLENGIPGILGIHFEGPFINPEKAGVHDKTQIRPSNPEDVDIICSLRDGVTLLTLAPEAVPGQLVSSLADRGVFLSIGHSNADYKTAMDAFSAGASCTTHLFNAMSQFMSREPGVVGAALDDGKSWAGIIVDGFHVDFPAVRVAWRAKQRRKMFLVTDAMPPVGSETDHFRLGSHAIRVQGGRCVTPDGVLAGSAIGMATAVRNCIQRVGIPTDEALRMASTYPAEFIGMDKMLGRIAPRYRANLAIFNNQIHVSAVVVNGEFIAVT